MNRYGRLFRKLRKEKNYSLKEIAEGNISVSFLSKFERGESDISLTNFYSLLGKLNITLEEFSFIANNYKSIDFEVLLNEMKIAYENNNLLILTDLRKKEIELWKTSRLDFHRCNAIMIGALLYNLDSDKIVTEDEKDFLSNYLLAHDSWGYYEMVIFGNSMGVLTLQAIITLSKEVLKRSQLYLNLRNNRTESIRIILNTIVCCIEGDKLSEALYFISTLENLIANHNYYFEKNKLLFLNGIYKIKMGEIENGEMFCRKSILIMKELDSSSAALNHEDYLEKLLEKLE
ncbi:helix-turn-helix domain-containing protein [Peribacillus muralis]|uniref:helix-turn-helix domain-containing protein n=1 Tax=Peribacillus muralis TaxID=264697 RepID=UPI001F4E4AC9|nr:Rgg/GadR/MutR family transcriptional regulator [Peribacillus muralis]MCK1994221.1 helix-turn-helix domain-containing protein [Peribacillus muralis]MCK2014994.1 helix-turn-helix domain-containing protein [Peribacillus muralis]